MFGGVLLLLWNFAFKPKIDKWNNRVGVQEFYTGLHEPLNYLSCNHKIVSGVLVGIGIVFGLLSILVS